MRVIGVFSVGLLLTYVFQVQVAPYDRPIEFWPSIPASTWIYALGLVGILLLSFLALLNSLLLKKALVADGFTGNVRRPYDLPHLPVEGVASEEDLPLLDKKRQISASNDDHQQEKTAPESLGDSCDRTLETVEEDAPASFAENNEPAEHPPPEDPPVSNMEEVQYDYKSPASRRSNQKIYSVLSVQEAALVNKLVRMDFIVRTVSPKL